jgi:hypothetical protein
MKTPTTWPDGRPRSRGNAFDILYQPRSAAVMETKQTPRRQRMSAREKTLKALQDNTARSIVIGKPADADKTARIRGARLGGAR